MREGPVAYPGMDSEYLKPHSTPSSRRGSSSVYMRSGVPVEVDIVRSMHRNYGSARSSVISERSSLSSMNSRLTVSTKGSSVGMGDMNERKGVYQPVLSSQGNYQAGGGWIMEVCCAQLLCSLSVAYILPVFRDHELWASFVLGR